MAVDFLIVFKVASLARRAGRKGGGAVPVPLATCRALASGKDVPAAALGDAQLFAMRWWSNLSLALFVPILLVAVSMGLLRPGKPGRVVMAGVMFVLFALITCAIAQVVLQKVRNFATRSWVRRVGSRADLVPLPSGSAGLPRSRDFWVATGIAIVFFGFFAYAAVMARAGR